jgi:hypothetical protein
VTFNLCLDLSLSPPSFSTAMLWIKKIGYAKLKEAKTRADDWIIIVDESIGIGQEKVLVVLGIRRCNIDFTRPLKIQDMEPILVKSREKWSGPDVALELMEVKQNLGTILYAVTDAGKTIKKGLKDAAILWRYDITHAIAIMLDKMYRNDKDFKYFTYEAGMMRYKYCCSKQAHLIPPNQRAKSRFLNIDIISKWGLQALKAYDNKETKQEDRLCLQWVKEMESFILELGEVMSIIQKISIVLKNQGLSKQTIVKCKACLNGCNNGKLKQFKNFMIEYLNEQSRQKTKHNETLLCCSDVIESTFGKYKNELSKNPMNGITDLVLLIPALTAKLEVESVKKAIDSCTVTDIEEWKKENLCNSLLVKRNAVFKN